MRLKLPPFELYRSWFGHLTTLPALNTPKLQHFRGKCPERYAREENLTNCFADRLRELVIDPEIIEWLRDELVI